MFGAILLFMLGLFAYWAVLYGGLVVLDIDILDFARRLEWWQYAQVPFVAGIVAGWFPRTRPAWGFAVGLLGGLSIFVGLVAYFGLVAAAAVGGDQSQFPRAEEVALKIGMLASALGSAVGALMKAMLRR